MSLERTIWVVGVGISAPAQTDRWTIERVRQAEIVFHLLFNPVELAWIERLRPDARALAGHYEKCATRRDAYTAMTVEVLECASRADPVCVVFYGHPLIGSTVATMLLANRPESVHVEVTPAISAVDCLLADACVDPFDTPVCVMDATYLLQRPNLPPQHFSLVILQAALAGEPSARYPSEMSRRGLGALADLLGEHYGHDHDVLVYEAAIHPAYTARLAWTTVAELPKHELEVASTLFVPGTQN